MAKTVDEDIADKAKSTVKDVAAQAQDVAERAMERGREATEGVHDVAENFKKAVDKSVNDQPMATLALAAAVGFVLGAIWKS